MALVSVWVTAVSRLVPDAAGTWLRLRVWLRWRGSGSAPAAPGEGATWPHTSGGSHHLVTTRERTNVRLLNTVTRRGPSGGLFSVFGKIESLPCRGRRTLISHHDWWKIFSHSLWMMMGFRVIVIWKKRRCISHPSRKWRQSRFIKTSKGTT